MTDAVPLVSIIILNWNGCSHLPDCLDSLAAQTFRDFEVILVDNGSTDASVDLVRDRYPWVRLLPLQKNSGFATGNNHGLDQARGKYIVTLNNDTRAEADWLEVLVGVAEAHPRAGMVGSRICSFGNPDLIDSLGVEICRDGMSRGRYRHRRWSSLSLPAVEEILLPSACAALYRRAMLRKIGFFDDDFFAYAEDTDLGLRGRLAGWDALLATDAVVYHKYSQTSGRLSPFKVRLVERNHYWVAVKNFPLLNLLLLPWFTVLRYGEQLRGMLLGRGTGGAFLHNDSPLLLGQALLLGMVQALIGTPRMWAKRRQVQGSRKIATRPMRQLLRRHRLSFRKLLAHD
jgi:GT2 family glycosyltransferase